MSNKEFDRITDIANGLSDLTNGGSVPIEKVVTSEFMSQYTDSNDLKSFFDKHGITEDDINNDNFSKIDPLVKANSQFDSWQDMINNAGKLYVINQFDL